MSKDQIASNLHGVLQEFTNGYVILGTSAVDGSAIARFWSPDDATRAKLNEMVDRLHNQGGLPVPAEVTDAPPQVSDPAWTRN